VEDAREKIHKNNIFFLLNWLIFELIIPIKKCQPFAPMKKLTKNREIEERNHV
jgi:hypothetical protein